jgi:hypothetical protein
MDKSYAFVTGSDVFHTIVLSDTLTIGQRWIIGMDSNPSWVKCNLHSSLCSGSTWDGNNFYLPDTDSPVIEETEDALNGSVKYAGIVNDIVFGLITFDVESFSPEEIQMLDAAMQSEPYVVEIAPNTQVEVGWTWDGSSFHPSVEEL